MHRLCGAPRHIMHTTADCTCVSHRVIVLIMLTLDSQSFPLLTNHPIRRLCLVCIIVISYKCIVCCQCLGLTPMPNPNMHLLQPMLLHHTLSKNFASGVICHARQLSSTGSLHCFDNQDTGRVLRCNLAHKSVNTFSKDSSVRRRRLQPQPVCLSQQAVAS